MNVGLIIIIIRNKHQSGDTMYKAYKFRMYPDDKQRELIHKVFRCTRFVHNPKKKIK